MMFWGGGNAIGGGIALLALIAFVSGVVLVAAWLVRAIGGQGEDAALRVLRERFARGDIDAQAFAEARRVLEDGPPAAGAARSLALGGLGLIALAVLLWLLAGWGMSGPGRGLFGPSMMGQYQTGQGHGPWMMFGAGPGPTAPAGTAVRMAASRFDPLTLTITAGEAVRWFNDDSLPHTVTAVDGSWDSGNLAPGAGYERRFDVPGSYVYICLYHPGMTGTVEVRAP